MNILSKFRDAMRDYFLIRNLSNEFAALISELRAELDAQRRENARIQELHTALMADAERRYGELHEKLIQAELNAANPRRQSVSIRS